MKIKHQRLITGRVPNRSTGNFVRRSGKPQPSPKALQRSFNEAMSLL